MAGLAALHVVLSWRRGSGTADEGLHALSESVLAGENGLPRRILRRRLATLTLFPGDISSQSSFPEPNFQFSARNLYHSLHLPSESRSSNRAFRYRPDEGEVPPLPPLHPELLAIWMETRYLNLNSRPLGRTPMVPIRAHFLSTPWL